MARASEAEWNSTGKGRIGPVLAGALLLACAVILAACGNESATDAPVDAEQSASVASVWPHDNSDIPVDPVVTFGRLETGLRYAVLHNETPRNTVSLRLHVAAGSLNETEDQRGLAHFLEHMAFKGSENLPGDALVTLLERRGLAFGPDTNAYTGFEQTVYMLELPEANADLLREGLSVFREIAGRLTLAPDAIEAERGVILSERRARNTPAARQVEALYDFLAPGTRVANRFPIGTVEVIETADRDRFAAFYEDHYRPERMILIAVGDVDAADTARLIEELFADFIREGEGASDPQPEPLRAETIRTGHFFDPDIATQVQLYTLQDYQERPDTAAARRQALMRALGHNILSRRLLSLSRAPDAVFLGGSASSFDFFEAARLSAVSLTTTPEQWPEAVALAEQEVRRALMFGFRQDELDEQLANYETALVNAVEAASTRDSAALAGGLLASLANDGVFSTPETDLALFRATVSTLTVADVDGAFRQTWEGRPPLLFLAGNLDVADPGTALITAYEQSQTVALTPPVERAQSTFAYTDFGPAGTLAERDVVEDLGIIRVRFANNVRLNLKPTEFEAETIRILTRVGGGLLEAPADQPGLPLLANYGFLSGGLEAHSLDDLVRLYAGVTADIDFSVAADAFEFTGITDEEDLDQFLNLLTAYLSAPGYREEAVIRFRKGLDILYDSIDATPAGIVQKDVVRMIRSDDPRFGLPAPDEAQARTLEELRDWLTGPLTGGPLEIGVVGDFDPDTVIAAVARTLGALPVRPADRPPYDAGRVLRFPMLADPQVLHHGGEPDRALAQVYWPVPDGRERLTARRLTVLGEVLQLRLTEEVRREAGATYSPIVRTSTGTVFPDYGYVVASLDLDPAETPAYLDRLLSIAEELATDGLTEDEFLRARTPILESIEEQMERNPFWLYGVVTRAQSAPQELAHFRTVMDTYAAMTKDEVEATARAYLTPARAARFMVLPPQEGGEGTDQ